MIRYGTHTRKLINAKNRPIIIKSGNIQYPKEFVDAYCELIQERRLARAKIEISILEERNLFVEVLINNLREQLRANGFKYTYDDLQHILDLHFRHREAQEVKSAQASAEWRQRDAKIKSMESLMPGTHNY